MNGFTAEELDRAARDVGMVYPSQVLEQLVAAIDALGKESAEEDSSTDVAE